MVAAKNKSIKGKRNKTSPKLSTLRSQLNQKNESKAPQKHYMCRKIFCNYIKEMHSDIPAIKGLYPVTGRNFKDVIFAGCMDYY